MSSEWSKKLLDEIEWKRFEDVCAYYFILNGYKEETTQIGADGGIDIIIYKDNSDRIEAIVQCKSWRNYKVGVKEIRELLGIMASKKTIGIFITNSLFTEEALKFGEENRIGLIDGEKFVKLIHKMPEKNRIKLLEMATEGDFNVPTCPSCGVKMKLRKAKKGWNEGKDFWGCQNYPKCKRIFNQAS